MRDLFEETGRPAIDPHESARQSARAPERKRFYKAASARQEADGFAILLDGKPVQTPSRHPLNVPLSAIAEFIVAEWNAQVDVIDPLSMPVTRLANSVIDAVIPRREAVRDDVAKYFASDLLFYRAGHPEALVAQESRHWDPVLAWAADSLGAHFILAEGVMHVQQPEQAIAIASRALPSDAWRIAALHVITTITGSALLALALHRNALTPDAVWQAAHVDEDWNIEAWGDDPEVSARRAARRIDFDGAMHVLAAVNAAKADDPS